MTPEERATRLAEIRESVRDWVDTVPAECSLWPPRVRFVLGLLDDARAELKRVEAERDEAAQEVAEMVEFLQTHLGWEWFWSDGWVGEDVKSQARQNAQAIRKFLNETGHSKRFSLRLKAALEREARLREALVQLAECADAFGLELPEGEYKGLGNLRFAIRHARALAAPGVKSEMEGPAGPALPMQHASSEPGASREPAGPFGPDADAVARMRAEGEELRKELARRVEPMKHRPFYASTRRIQELEADVEGLKLQKAGAVRALGRVMGELREARALALEYAAKVADSRNHGELAAAIRAQKDEATSSPQTAQSKPRTR